MWMMAQAYIRDERASNFDKYGKRHLKENPLYSNHIEISRFLVKSFLETITCPVMSIEYDQIKKCY